MLEIDGASQSLGRRERMSRRVSHEKASHFHGLRCCTQNRSTMLKALCYGLLIRQPRTQTLHSTKRFMSTVDPLLLAQDWSKQLMSVEDSSRSLDRIIQATRNSLPLLEDASSVPFVCRYRTDVISPLTTQQVFMLYSLKQKHASLASLRSKLLDCVSRGDEALLRRIQTSTSKSELDDLYAPFKPPSKGSILERIQKEHPELVEHVEAVWSGNVAPPAVTKLRPRDALVHLLGTKIASELKIMEMVVEELIKHCRVKTSTEDAKYRNYNDFSCPLVHLKDYQVLAIRRGVQQKAIKMGYDVDGDKVQRMIKWQLRQLVPWINNAGGGWNKLLDEAVQDAWSRLLRRRGTSRLWSEKCKEAEERAMQVFEENLRHALLAPPLPKSSHVLSLDPGYQAGIKCAVLDPNGKVLRLETVQYLGSRRKNGMKQLRELLKSVQDMTETKENVIVALGNGHGSQEGRALIEEVAKQTEIPIDIHLVSEAGASVWSVTQTAKEEFPDQPPSAIASVSIGRRLQNPLHDLVKVPPKSLGLGMYQHDLSEKELDEKLHLTSVDAVATVGVDVNACGVEILQKVPGLTKLASKIVEARPLSQRKDLLGVSGLGPKTFENCAAFCRVEQGSEPLDATLVHPESYDIARWLLKQFRWDLSKIPNDIPPRREWLDQWGSFVTETSEKFGVSQERVLAVIENLVDSMTGIDPRLRDTENTPIDSARSFEGCVLLSPELAGNPAKLQEECPVRGIVGTIRNIADFGAFIDFGGHSDGLLHTSCLGPVNLRSLLIGQQIGVDILSVENDRVSLGLAGLGLTTERSVAQGSAAKTSQSRNYSTSSRRGGHISTKKKSDSSSSTKKRSVTKNDATSSLAKRRKTAR